MINEKKLVEELKENNFDILMTDADCFGLEKCTENVIELINKQPKVGEWIPCSERLPENDTNVIACFATGTVTELRYIRGGVFSGIYEYNTEVIIAWQPLPDPYKQNDE